MTLRSNIAIQYLLSWFTIDILSCFPFDLVVASALRASGTTSGTNLSIIQLVKVLRMLRIFKLLRNVNFTQIQNKLEDHFYISAGTISLTQAVLQVVFAAHLVACFWWGITAGGAIAEGPHWYEDPQVFDNLAGG